MPETNNTENKELEGFRIAPGALRFDGRTIVRVIMPDYDVQPFYRALGKNAPGFGGKWIPFDQITYPGWFDKNRFFTGHPWRYGCYQLYQASLMLEALYPTDKEILILHVAQTAVEVNDWIDEAWEASLAEANYQEEWRTP